MSQYNMAFWDPQYSLNISFCQNTDISRKRSIFPTRSQLTSLERCKTMNDRFLLPTDILTWQWSPSVVFLLSVISVLFSFLQLCPVVCRFVRVCPVLCGTVKCFPMMSAFLTPSVTFKLSPDPAARLYTHLTEKLGADMHLTSALHFIDCDF